MGLSVLGRTVLYPLLNTLRQIPLLSLTLLFAVWFGGAEKGIYAFVIFGVSVMIMINTLNATRNIHPVHTQYAVTLGASRARVVRTVVIPGILPELAGGVKVALGLAWAMVLGAEFLGTQTGLGRLMILFEQFGLTGQMVVVLCVLLSLALCAHLVVSLGFSWLTRWRPRAVES
jgi:ABC-type nitrate/sulfonate/bicarbonate transport system permease component